MKNARRILIRLWLPIVAIKMRTANEQVNIEELRQTNKGIFQVPIYLRKKKSKRNMYGAHLIGFLAVSFQLFLDDAFLFVLISS